MTSFASSVINTIHGGGGVAERFVMTIVMQRVARMLERASKGQRGAKQWA